MVIVGIDIEIDQMVSQIAHVLLAARGNVATRVRWTQVSGYISHNVVECHLNIVDLLLSILGRDFAQIEMRPCMRSDLVSFSAHAFNSIDVFLCLVDLTLSVVVASNEERSLRVVFLE